MRKTNSPLYEAMLKAQVMIAVILLILTLSLVALAIALGDRETQTVYVSVEHIELLTESNVTDCTTSACLWYM
jgi:hypothetical protein